MVLCLEFSLEGMGCGVVFLDRVDRVGWFRFVGFYWEGLVVSIGRFDEFLRRCGGVGVVLSFCRFFFDF